MAARVGDWIVMVGKNRRAAPRERSGQIEQVLSEDPPRYAVRWRDGRLTVLAPLPDAIRIVPAKGRAGSKATSSKRAAGAKPAAGAKSAKAAPKAGGSRQASASRSRKS